MKKENVMRSLLFLAAACLSLICFCACSGDKDDAEFVEPVVTGVPLSDWPSDEIFRDVPKFTAGTFDKDNSTLKAGNNLLFFTGVGLDAYEAYYQAMNDAGFVDKIAGGGSSSMVRSARFSNDEGTVMVNLNYKTTDNSLKITLIEVAPADEEK